jgi:hypothetical protein
VPAVRLGRPVPNPVRDRTRITYALPFACPVRLAVFDLGGRCVAALADGIRGPGEHAIEWRPRLANGLYFLRLQAAGREATRRIVVGN